MRPAGRRGGFTLVEIMVVMIIMSVVFSLAAVNLMPGDDKTVVTEAARMALILEHAYEDASITGEPLGLALDNNSYSFKKMDDGGRWIDYQDDMFRKSAFEHDIVVEALIVDDAPVDAKRTLLLSPYGGDTPFTLRLGSGGAAASLTMNILGRVTVNGHENNRTTL